MEQKPPEVSEAGELVHEASVDEIGDDDEKDETREEMRPRHRSTMTPDAERDSGDREECGDQRRDDTNAREIDLAVGVSSRRRGWLRYSGSRWYLWSSGMVGIYFTRLTISDRTC